MGEADHSRATLRALSVGTIWEETSPLTSQPHNASHYSARHMPNYRVWLGGVWVTGDGA